MTNTRKHGYRSVWTVRHAVFATVVAVAAAPLPAAGVYVSPQGADGADGSRTHPFRTIARAVGGVAAGDRILLLEGRYADPVVVSGIRGTDDAPVTIGAASGAKVVFDGTDDLAGLWKRVRPQSPQGRPISQAQWKRIGDRALYAMRLERDVYALVYDGRLMSEARWPNGNWDAPYRLDRWAVLRRANEKSTLGELHDDFPTENALQESRQWLHYDRQGLNLNQETLADTGVDFTGSVVVISHAWTSFATRVTEHGAGRNHFKFDTAFRGSNGLRDEAIHYVVDHVQWDTPQRFKRSSHGGIHYFMMGLAALDHPGEWWYDEPTGTVYFIAPGGGAPEPGKARGKRRDYLVTLRGCRHVHFGGVQMFGSAILMEDCAHSRIEDCTFLFSSNNKVVLGNFDMPVTTRLVNQRATDDAGFHNALVNCQFRFLDGNAFEGWSEGLAVDNVLICQTQQTTLGNDSRSASLKNPSLVRRVTIRNVGASVGIRGGGRDGIYELNNISRFGGLQYDGAALQMGGRHHVIYRYNWSHDHPKRSFRFDAASYPRESNAFGEMSYNVAWNTPGGFAVKGDDHLVHNNVALGDSQIQLFNMERWASENSRTLVANNAVRRFTAGRNDRGKAKGLAKVVAVMKSNLAEDATSYLRDPQNLDFRPKPGSPLVDAGYAILPGDVPWKKSAITGADSRIGRGPDIGPYEYGASHYWIPGFRFPHASTPVPPDGTTSAKADCDLMWLGGYKADWHDLYFGTMAEEVASATEDAPPFRRTFHGSENIFDPGRLEPGKTYFWRVDAIRGGQTTRGETWSFTVDH